MASVTVQQVALAAGVSRSTANKVLLGEAALFRETTANKVLEAAKALGYRPNMLARGLRQQRTYLIGTLLSSVNASLAYELYNGIQHIATEHDCAPITFSCPDREQESRSIQLCLDRQVDAMLVNTAPTTSTPQNQQLLIQEAKRGLPMVELFGRNLDGVPSIVSDYHAAGYLATQKLVASGLKRIVYWSPYPFDDQTVSNPTHWYALDMYRGYQKAMREAALTSDFASHDIPTSRREAVAQLTPQARRLLTGRPETQAVITPGEYPAQAISQALSDDPTIVVPGFVQACFLTGSKPIGLPDRRLGIRIHAREIGESAARMAFQLLQGERPEDQCITPEIEDL